ncbi:RlpA-like double-psi beta-barrel-protein domain-containing protein-containing protein [Mucidula mucida]|nr:RlpA-like double-psi beta-barrel-protein domain-containing protein-containing protein [Mucidula mucida]
MLFRNLVLAIAFATSTMASPAHAPIDGGRLLRHRSLAARVAEPQIAANPIYSAARRTRRTGRRDLTRRQCRTRPSSSSESVAATPVSSQPAAVVLPSTEATQPETTSTEDQTSTEQFVPEVTSTTEQAQYTPPADTTTVEEATSTSAAESSGSTGSSSSGSGSHTGEITFYATGLGACGITNVDTDPIVAVSICNKKIQVYYEGKTTTVTVTDRCGGCAENDLDFSPTSFSILADQSLGRLTGATWDYV